MKHTLAGCCVALAALGSPAWGQIVNTLKPTTNTPDCTASGCHASQLNHQVLHGPTAVSACESCHESVDPAAHSFKMKRPGRQLCDFCHIDKTGTEGPVVHKPVADGDCTGCHDPHGASNRKMLKQETVPQLCMQCHKETLAGAHVHKPAGDDCTLCHQPHTSTHAKLLSKEKQALCTSCHAKVAAPLAASAHPHKPATEDCLSCHSPHASAQDKVLTLPPRELCASCHKDVADKAMNATFLHAAVQDERACLNCHSPHFSEHVKQLTKDPIDLCLDCHKKPIKNGKQVTVKGVPELADESMHRHGPIQAGDCAACHAVHGGEHESLLVRNYSSDFYLPFSEESYALCLGCHDKQILLAQPTSTQTKFRDGERNLHTVHVVSGGKSRNCRACHSIHASRFETQIADSSSFGEWKLPINYQQTPTGGSCAPGCHKPAQFDRVNAANSKVFGTAAPGATPAVPPAAAPGTPAADPPATPSQRSPAASPTGK